MTKKELMTEIGKEILGLTAFKEHNGAFNSGMIEAFTRCAKLIEQLPDDDPQLMQKGPDGMMYPCPVPVQPEPSPLEVALRIIATGTGMNATECVGYAFKIIDAVKAEEAKRAGEAMSGAETLDTPMTPYAYTEVKYGWNKKALTVYCWSHESKRWGYCIDPIQFSDWRWKDAKFNLPPSAKTFEFYRGMSPYDAAVKMGVIV